MKPAREALPAGQQLSLSSAASWELAGVVLGPGQRVRQRGVQVVRHERASIKADIWSYGILVWELISGQDITELQPLAIARQAAGRKVLPGKLSDLCGELFAAEGSSDRWH